MLECAHVRTRLRLWLSASNSEIGRSSPVSEGTRLVVGDGGGGGGGLDDCDDTDNWSEFGLVVRASGSCEGHSRRSSLSVTRAAGLRSILSRGDRDWQSIAFTDALKM